MNFLHKYENCTERSSSALFCIYSTVWYGSFACASIGLRNTQHRRPGDTYARVSETETTTKNWCTQCVCDTNGKNEIKFKKTLVCTVLLLLLCCHITPVPNEYNFCISLFCFVFFYNCWQSLPSLCECVRSGGRLLYEFVFFIFHCYSPLFEKRKHDKCMCVQYRKKGVM